MSILITGSTGMLGAYLLKKLLLNKTKELIFLTYRTEEKKNTTLSFLLDFNIPQSQLDALVWIKGDLLDTCFLEDIIKDDMHIYHCAALVSFNKKDADYMINNNVVTTENLINASLNKKNIYFLHVSSIAAIGREDIQQVVSETSQWTNSDANSAYAISKNLAEMEVWRGFEEGLKGSIINPSIILGVFPKSKSSLKLFDLAQKEFPFYTTGENGFVDVEDVVKTMLILNNELICDQRYIISGGNYSYQTIFNGIADGLNKKQPKYKTTYWLGQIAITFDLIKSLFGNPRTLSQDLLKTSLQNNHYTNEKFIKSFQFTYTPISESLQNHSKYYKALI